MVFKSHLTKSILALLLISNLQLSAWDKNIIGKGIALGAFSKFFSYALVKGAEVPPSKAILPTLIFGVLANSINSESKEELTEKQNQTLPKNAQFESVQIESCIQNKKEDPDKKTKEFLVGCITWSILTLILKKYEK